MPTVAPYGSWKSPITAEDVTRSGVRFADVVRVDGDDVYWVESRPQESGRSVIVRRSAAGVVDDVGPDDFDARTRVHEYGGGAYVTVDGDVVASRFDDQRLFRIDPEGSAAPITPPAPTPGAWRYADLDVRGDRAVGVRERHDPGAGPTNELVRIDLSGDAEPVVIAAGRDFYAHPRISPDGTRLCWLEWDHPNMPWDGTELRVADFDGDRAGQGVLIAGGEEESITQPEWSPAGVLYFVSDRSGWWNLYRADRAESILPMDAEFGLPDWVFAQSRYAFRTDGAIVAIHSSPDGDRMIVIRDGEIDSIALPFTSLGSWLAICGHDAVVVAGGPDVASCVVSIDTTDGTWSSLRPADESIDPGYVSIPEPITFSTPDGPAHALYYPPSNPDFIGPDDAAPPLIVQIHGGPTSQARRSQRPAYAFWTSRGFGIVDVDHGGSSGYGRAYRNRLHGAWGVVDVRDCALAAAHLAELGLADPAKLIITGGSAGGYTTLLALALRSEFSAGASYYGIGDLTALAEDTHKFESRYLDRLVGPYPAAEAVYRERSALNHLDGFTTPVILFQGMEDRVVPPSQTETMRDALIARGVPVACVMFEGEGHGFREARNQIAALEAELSFYGQILGFTPADDITPVEIVGLA